MKKASRIIVVTLVVLVALLVAGFFALNAYVNRQEFKDYVVAKTQEQLAVPLQVGSLQVSLLSGFELRGIAVKNPPGSQRDSLLEGKEMVFRYRLLPLLQRRVQIETVNMQGANIVLEKAADGTWNYEKLTKEKTASAKNASKDAKTTSAGSPPSGLDFELSKLNVANANLLFLKPGGTKLIEVDDLDVTSTVMGSAQSLNARGDLGIQRAAIIETIEARDLRSPITVVQQQLKLTDLTGKLEDGTLKGTVLVDLQKEGYPYTVHAEVADVDVGKLAAKFSDKAKYLTGTLRLNTDVSGTGGDTAKLKGKGSAHVDKGTLTGIPILQTVATLLGMSELERLQFDEITLEYTMDNGVIETPVIKLMSKDIQLTGSGRTDFDFNLKHQLTLALSPALTSRLPKEVLGAFGKREDGFSTLAFNVTGPYDKPKTDLTDKLVKGAAGSLIEKGLEQFLGEKKKKK